MPILTNVADEMFGVPPRFFIVQPSSRKTGSKLNIGWLTGTWSVLHCDVQLL